MLRLRASTSINNFKDHRRNERKSRGIVENIIAVVFVFLCGKLRKRIEEKSVVNLFFFLWALSSPAGVIRNYFCLRDIEDKNLSNLTLGQDMAVENDGHFDCCGCPLSFYY